MFHTFLNIGRHCRVISHNIERCNILHLSRCNFARIRVPQVSHPIVPEPEHLPPPKYKSASLNPLQQFIPKNFYYELRLDGAREGTHLGEDFPYNFLPKWKSWRRRKYNIECKNSHTHSSEVKGVSFSKRLNVFMVQWQEDGVHRIRWFRAAFGIQQAKASAERFRKNLIATGRVDSAQTARQILEKAADRRKELRIRKRRFAKIASGQF